MPPKAKFSKEEIINTALDLVRQEGAEALTARSLGDKLGSSPRPIFTLFSSMEDVRSAVTEKAKNLYNEYVKTGLADTIAFKGVGTQYILFSIKEPKLFQLLFMTEKNGTEISSALPVIDGNYEAILNSVITGYDLPYESAKNLYRHLWIYTHGIASLCATKTCKFSAQEISDMLTQVFKSLLKNIKETE